MKEFQYSYYFKFSVSLKTKNIYVHYDKMTVNIEIISITEPICGCFSASIKTS